MQYKCVSKLCAFRCHFTRVRVSWNSQAICLAIVADVRDEKQLTLADEPDVRNASQRAVLLKATGLAAVTCSWEVNRVLRRYKGTLTFV